MAHCRRFDATEDQHREQTLKTRNTAKLEERQPHDKVTNLELRDPAPEECGLLVDAELSDIARNFNKAKTKTRESLNQNPEQNTNKT